MSITDHEPLSAIVTGAAQGIGAAEAEQLVATGRTVILNDLDATLLEQTTEKLGDRAVAVAGDIADTETARALVAAATRDGRRLDVVINNAGAIANAPIQEISDTDFDRILAVNLRGPYMLSREAAIYWRQLASRADRVPRSTLINTTSRAALLANPTQSNYAAAKAGVAVMTQILARELKPAGVRCNVIAPRAYTKMMRDGSGEFDASVLADWAPEHIGRFAAFLCGPGGADVTGQIFVVHGPRVSLVKPWSVSDPVEVDYSADDATLITAVFGDAPTQIAEFEVDDLPVADPGRRRPFRVEQVIPPPATMS